jgi:Glycosyltransferase family 87
MASIGAGTRRARPIRDIGIPGFIVLIGVLVGFRLLGIYPWNAFAFDLHTYWLTRDGVNYANQHAGPAGMYLYSPAFAQLIRPLTILPLQVFAAIWTAIGAALLVWITGRRVLLIALLPPVIVTLVQGQLDIAFAAVAVLGLRWPALWALPLLTKITPGIGIVWFLVRREWRSLVIALGVTLGVMGVSFLIDPAGWVGWAAMLLRAEFPANRQLVYLDVPLTIRMPIALALLVWGARSNRTWTIPVAMTLAMPIVWANSVTILVALVPLLAQQRAAVATGEARTASAQRGRSAPGSAA